MEPSVGDGVQMGRVECLLDPLPTITLGRSVDKLDAGLRSLDHCAQHCFRTLLRECPDSAQRQDEVTTMALHSSSATHPSGALGNTVPGSNAKGGPLSCP